MGLMKPLLLTGLKVTAKATQATHSVTSKEPAHFCLALKKAIS